MTKLTQGAKAVRTSDMLSGQVINMLETAGYDLLDSEKYKTVFGTSRNADIIVNMPISDDNPTKTLVICRQQNNSGSTIEKIHFTIDSAIKAVDSGQFGAVILIANGSGFIPAYQYFTEVMEKRSEITICNHQDFTKHVENTL